MRDELQRILYLIFFGIIKDSSGNTVQVLLTNTGHLSASTLSLLGNLHLLELKKDRSDDTSISLTEVLGSSSSAVVSTIPFPQLANTNSGAEVYFTCDGGGTDVVPVITVGSEVLGDGGLDKVGPDGELEFVTVLQVLGVGGDEGLGRHIADTDSSGFFGHGCYLMVWRCG